MREEAHQHRIGRSVLTGNRHAADRCSVALAAHQKLTIATTQRRAAVKQGVAIIDFRQQRGADFSDVGRTLHHTVIEILDIGVLHLELQTSQIDAAIDYGIEREGVVRTGRYAQF